ncbi:MAG: SPOR domain-containing protein [Gammaproteobacteria bacterium]|nr:SPOR domain-containing protein [Gammaproteobacteria bacterium]MDE0365895.1 SPOR domain-containing protein [Gammaproteobacteria bacterium]
MTEQTRYRITGSLFLLALAVIFLPMLFDGDGVPGVVVAPVDVDFVPEAVQRFEEAAPASDFAERVAELRQEVDEQGFHLETGTRIGEPVLSVPDDATDAWAVQLASFARQENAMDLRDKLRADGFEAFVTSYRPPGGDVLNRVAVGPFLDVSRAERLQRELSQRYEVEARIMAFGS